MPAGFTPETLLREVVEPPRRAFEPLPDMTIIDRPGWLQLITPSFRSGGFNDVAFSMMNDAEADSIIDATIARYEKLGLQFRWSVGPGSRPLDLAERLERRGLVRNTVCGMARGTEGFALPAPDTTITVEQVDEKNEATFSRLTAQAWDMDVGPLADYHRMVLASASSRFRLFLARFRGEPAGTASYAVFEKSAYLMGGVVLHPLRGRGIYRALVGARVRDAAARGLPLLTSHAGTMSAPILERLGFETVCRFPIFTSSSLPYQTT